VRNNIHTNAVRDFDITFIQFRLLRQIRRGARTMGELAEKHQISRPAISQAVDLLVKKGLIARHQDDQDRRYVNLEVTEKGDLLLNEIMEKNHVWMNEKMTNLSRDELEIILNAMSILHTTFLQPPDHCPAMK
jgi:DNA-binding MarR family transcriptional regulator